MENIKCQYCKKNVKTKNNKNEHELGGVLHSDREGLTVKYVTWWFLCKEKGVGVQKERPRMERIKSE